MNKTITLSDQQHSLLVDLFSSIADLDLQEHCDDASEFDSLWDAVIDAEEVKQMSCLQNEMILENIFEEVQEAFPYLSADKQIEIANQRFEDLSQ